MQVILGSQSPRRKEILSFFSLPFQQAHPNYDEDSHPFHGNPTEYAAALANGKSEILVSQFPDAIIITADTVVFRDGKVYGKPQNETDAFRDLSELIGHWHSVFTAVTVRKGSVVHSAVEETRVLFNTLTPQQIRTYQSRIHCADKAGGYAIQAAGSLIVRKIEGCYYNVMGLPINTLQRLLLHVGVDLWDYLPA